MEFINLILSKLPEILSSPYVKDFLPTFFKNNENMKNIQEIFNSFSGQNKTPTDSSVGENVNLTPIIGVCDENILLALNSYLGD